MAMNKKVNTPRLMSGGEAIVDSLKANGVDTVFGLPGVQMYPLFDALHQASNTIQTIGARHEQACAYMAFGYARSTGRPGVFSVVPGPGVLNASAAIATALGASAPVLCLTGQIPSDFIGRGRGHLHELPDQLATIRSFTKAAARIERGAEAPRQVNWAFCQLREGRPGPVSLEMAWDVMARTERVQGLGAAGIEAALAPDPDQIANAARLIASAKRPIIFLGSGAQHASEAITALAEAIDAPVAAFRSGRGIVAEDHPLGVSSYQAKLLWEKSDLVIGIGTRLEMPLMRWQGMSGLVDRFDRLMIRIDIDPVEMVRVKADVGIVADSAHGARALYEAVTRLPLSKAGDATERVAAARAQAARDIAEIEPQMSYLKLIRDVMPRDGILVEELCQTGFTSYFGYPVLAPRSYISSGFSGTLGYGFQTALGVKIGNPRKAVVSITGDGGFMFGVQELATAVHHGIGLVTIVFNNASYGNVRRDQQERYGGRVLGSDLTNPDFVKLGEAFGVTARRVTTPVELRGVLEAALGADRPALIEVVLKPDSETSPWKFIHFAK